VPDSVGYGKISMLVQLPYNDELNFIQPLINQTFNESKLLSVVCAVQYAECLCIARRAISEIV
jgi:hypothetical protein